jgi:hypothetical protein
MFQLKRKKIYKLFSELKHIEKKGENLYYTLFKLFNHFD